jgi:hypothetical protein
MCKNENRSIEVEGGKRQAAAAVGGGDKVFLYLWVEICARLSILGQL